MIYRNQEQRCEHGFCQTGPRGVKCPECTQESTSPTSLDLNQGLLRIGRSYAGCKLLAQAGHKLTITCSGCDAHVELSRSTLLRTNRLGLQWRCQTCRGHFRRKQVTSVRVRSGVPAGYGNAEGRKHGEGNTNARSRY